MSDDHGLDIKTAQKGTQFKAAFVVTALVEKQSRNKKRFLNISLTNATGTIGSRVWEERIPAWEGVREGTAVEVEGNVEDGFPEGTLEVRAREVSVLPDDHPVRDYMNPVYPGDPQELRDGFEALRAEIRHPGYRLFLDRALESVCPAKRYFTAPAAMTNHHAYIGGLAEHSIEVTRSALHFADQPALKGLVNRDLVIVGGLIHDWGKIHEFEWEGVPIRPSDDALLFGHITTGALMVREALAQHGEELRQAGFTSRDAKYLIHMIVSHHGKTEWGSPTPPAMVASQLLHQADMMSAKVRQIADIARENPDRTGKIEVGRGDYWRGIIADPPAHDGHRTSPPAATDPRGAEPGGSDNVHTASPDDTAAPTHAERILATLERGGRDWNPPVSGTPNQHGRSSRQA